MSQLKNKSEINFMAAEALLKGGFHPSCCHPAYYSCLQLMKYLVQQELNISYAAQEQEIIRLKNSRFGRSGSHNYLIDKIVNGIKTIDKKEAKDFKRDIEDLKTRREEADYADCEVTTGNSIDAINKAKTIRLQLQRIFKK